MDKFTLCSRAMVLIGARPITSFSSTSAEEVAAETLYDGVVDEVISSYRWRFATAQFQLSRVTAPPAARWDAAYQLEPGTQIINAILVDDEPIRFDRYEDKVLCDARVADTVIADLTVRVNEAYWPGYFQSTVMLKLAASFAIPIAEDEAKAQLYEGKFLRQFAQAKLNDAQGRTARKLPVGALRRYHGGRP